MTDGQLEVGFKQCDGNTSDHSENQDLTATKLAEANDCSQDTVTDHEGKSSGPKTLNKYYCGAGSCQPKHMQVFANSKFFTFILSVFGMTETALIRGFLPVVVSSLERRYRFSSLSASFILSVFDVAVVLCGIFVSYFGEKGHKPKLLGVGFVIQGIGSLLFALPYALFGKYEVGSSTQVTFEACNDTVTSLSNCDAGNSIAYAIFIIANTIMGIGAAPLFTVGLTYLDDIVFPKWVPLHVGAFQISTILGPALGFGLGSAFLTIYVDPGEPTTLTEDDPGWVGAWWLGFLFAGVLSIVGAIPFFLYPRLLNDSHLVMEARQKQMKGTYKGKFGDETTFLKQVKAFPYHVAGVFRSKSWFFMTFGVTILFLALDGLIAFAPKYVETVYNVPSSTAGLMIGAMAIGAGASGALTGALIVYCVKIGKKMAIILWVISFVSLVPLLGFFFVCPNVDIAGISADHVNSSIQDPDDVLLASCNADCNCSSTIFEPVCGADGLSYFSPCRASCLKVLTNDPNNPDYVDCACLGDSVYTNGSLTIGSDVNRTAQSGLCGQDCNLLGGFVVSVTVFVYLIFMIEVPTLLVTIRTVADEQRSLALGLQSVIFRVFASIPGPIVFGAIVDSGCTYWQLECGRRANCWVYDNRLLSTQAYIFCTVCVFTLGVCTFLVWVFYPPVTVCCKKKPKSEMETKELQELAEEDITNPIKINGAN